MSSKLLRIADVRAMLTLFDELHLLRESPLLRRQEHALVRLSSLLNASVAGCGAFDAVPECDPSLRPLSTAIVGFSPAQVELWNQFLADLPRFRANPLACHVRDRLVECQSGPMVFTRPDVMDSRSWYASAYANELLRPTDIDPFVAVWCRSPDGRAIWTMTFRRPWRERPFSARAAALVQLFFEHASAMLFPLGTPGADDRLADLSPRQREVLQFLLDGASEKEIASKLHRSRNTVHGHVKALYRSFQVSSRAELLAQFIRPGLC